MRYFQSSWFLMEMLPLDSSLHFFHLGTQHHSLIWSCSKIILSGRAYWTEHFKWHLKFLFFLYNLNFFNFSFSWSHIKSHNKNFRLYKNMLFSNTERLFRFYQNRIPLTLDKLYLCFQSFFHFDCFNRRQVGSAMSVFFHKFVPFLVLLIQYLIW